MPLLHKRYLYLNSTLKCSRSGLVALTLLILLLVFSNGIDMPPNRIVEEATIYKVVIPLYLQGSPVLDVNLINFISTQVNLEDIRINRLCVDAGIFDDFLGANFRHEKLSDKFPVGIRYLGVEDYRRIFVHDPDESWDNYRATYKDKYYLELSRVGFDASMSRALVYFGIHCGDTCGSGEVYYLVKTDGRWIILGWYTLWVS
jgi:hypothetical protein